VIAELVDKGGDEVFILRSILKSMCQVVAEHIIASGSDDEEGLGEEVTSPFFSHLFLEIIGGDLKIRNLSREGQNICALMQQP